MEDENEKAVTESKRHDACLDRCSGGLGFAAAWRCEFADCPFDKSVGHCAMHPAIKRNRRSNDSDQCPEDAMADEFLPIWEHYQVLVRDAQPGEPPLIESQLIGEHRGACGLGAVNVVHRLDYFLAEHQFFCSRRNRLLNDAVGNSQLVQIKAFHSCNDPFML